MPKFLLCLPLALLACSAHAYDPCQVAGQEVRKIASARDDGVLLADLFRHTVDTFVSAEQEDRFFNLAALIYANNEVSADSFVNSVIDRCEAKEMAQ